MINGIDWETLERVYAVSGEGPVDRPYTSTKIVPNALTVAWQRTVEHGWRCARVEVAGSKGKGPAGAVPSATPASTTWDVWYREDGTVSWHGPVEPPLWATIVAMNDCPKGGPLEPVHEAVDAIDLDGTS